MSTAALAAAHQLSAQTTTQWNPPAAGSGGSASWNNAANWSNGVPVNDLTSSLALFDSTAYLFQPTLDANTLQAVNGLRFGDGTTAAAALTLSATTSATANQKTNGSTSSGSFNVTVVNAVGLAVGEQVTGTNIPAGTRITAINGNVLTLSQAFTSTTATATQLTFVPTLSLGTGGIVTALGVAGIQTISAPVSLGAAQSWTNNAALINALTVSGNIYLNTYQLTLDGTGTATGNNANTSLTGVITGSGSLLVNTSGTVNLSGANTFTGGVTLTGGKLILNSGTALGTGLLTINAGTTLSNNTTGGSFNIANAMQWNGDFTLNTPTKPSTFTGAINAAGPLTITATDASNSATIGSAIGGTANGIFDITKAGGGILTYSPNIALTQSQTAKSNGGTYNFSGVISSGAGSVFNISGTSGAYVRLSGANTSLLGGVSVNSGGLSIGNANALGTGTLSLAAGVSLDASAALVNANNNALNFGGNFTFTGSNSLDLGTGVITIPAGGLTITANASTLTLGGAISGGTIFDITKAGAGTLAYTPNITLTSNQTITSTGGIYRLGGTISGSGVGLTVAGGGTVQLTAADTYTGATTINTSTLSLAGAMGSVTSAITANGSTLALDSSTAGLTGATRAGNVTLVNGSSLTATGNTTANSVDAMSGVLTTSGVGGGYDIVTVAPGTGRNERLSIGSLARDTGGVFLFRGTALGTNSLASATASSTNIQLASAPTLVGGGGAAGSTNISIIPYAVGGTSTTDTGTTFVTYDATNGIRPLNTATEFATTLTAGDNTNNNVRLAAASTSVTNLGTFAADTTTTVNSLILQQAGVTTTVSGTGTIKITSGALLINPSGTNNTLTIAPSLDFGTAQAVIGFGRGPTLSGIIAGSGGLTIYGLSNAGTLNLTNTNSTYTGDTYILAHASTYSTGANFFPNGTRAGDLYVYASLDIAELTAINGLNGNGNINYGHSTSASVITLGGNNANGTYSGILSSGGTGNSFGITKIGTGTQYLLNNNSLYSRLTTLTGGVLSVPSINDGGVASALGAASASAGNLVFNGGTLQYTGAGSSTNRLFTVGVGSAATGAGTIDASGTGALNFTGTGTLAYGTAATATVARTRTLNLTGTNTADNTLAAVIGNNGTLAAGNNNGNVSLNKLGTGKWVLTNANTFSGATTIGDATAGAANIGSATANGGTLSAGGANALGGTGSIAVNNGGTLLVAASGSINDAAPVTLGTAGGTGVGGTIAVAGGVAEGTGAVVTNGVASGTNAAGLGALTLTSNSTLNFGTGTVGQLVFTTFDPGDNGAGGTFTLNVVGYENTHFDGNANSGTGADDRLIFSLGAGSPGLTSTQLSAISFGAGTSTTEISLGGGFYELGVTAVPEPSTIIASLGLLGVTMYRGRRPLARAWARRCVPPEA